MAFCFHGLTSWRFCVLAGQPVMDRAKSSPCRAMHNAGVFTSMWPCHRSLDLLACFAGRALPVIWQVLEPHARRDLALTVALRGIINVSAFAYLALPHATEILI